MRTIKIKIDKNKIYSLLFYMSCLLMLGLFFRRMLYTISLFDEVSNIALAYKVLLKQRPLVDIWEFQQMGSVFNAPFIYLFTKIKGNTEGLVLFLRMIYLLINILVAYIVTRIMNDYVNKKIKVLIGLSIVTYAPFSLYYLWFDTAAILLMLVGVSFILIANDTSGKKKDILLFIAGISHATMCYAYPSFISVVIVYVLIMILTSKKKNLLSRIISFKGYILGGILIAVVFLTYLIIYKDYVFFLDESIVSTNLSGRQYSILTHIKGIIWGSFVFLKRAILPTLILIFLYMKSYTSKYKNYYLTCFLTGISIVSFITLYDKTSLATFLHYFYLFLYTPLLYGLLTDRHKIFARKLIAYLWIPSIVTFFAVGFTANGGGVKSTFGVYTGTVCTIIMFALVIEQMIADEKNSLLKKISFSFGLVAIIFVNIGLYFVTGFAGQSVEESTYKMEEGIFKGLYSKPEDVFYIELQNLVEKQVSDTDTSIFFADSLQSGYLFTDLVPAEAHIWDHYIRNNEETREWETQFKYMDRVTGCPSIIVCRTEYEQEKPLVFKVMLSEKYYEAVRTDKVILYKLIS